MIGIATKLAIQGFSNKPVSRTFVVGSAAFIIFIGTLMMMMWTSFSKALVEIKDSYSLVAFLEPSLPQDKEKEVLEQISEISGVKDVQAVGKENFMSQFSKFFPQLAKDVSGLDSEIIPRYLKIRAEAKSVSEIKRQIENNKFIQQVETNPERFKNLIAALGTLKRYIFLLLVASICAVVSIFINHFKLDQIHRFQILSSMKLLGARVGQMYLPFVVEGMIEGFLAGLVAGGFLLFSGHLFDEQLSRLFFTLGYPYQSLPYLNVAGYSLVFAIAVGIMGSIWAIGISVVKK